MAYDSGDYLQRENPVPAGRGHRHIRSNYVSIGFVPKAKPARFCECGQKLSIANEGKSCFSCQRKSNTPRSL